MQAVIFCGIQGGGKSSFYRQRFVDTHLRLNLDMLRTRHREAILLRAMIQAKQPFVIDNTNPTPADRARYIRPARAAGFRIIGYFFDCPLEEALRRNGLRPEAQRIQEKGIRATHRRMRPPTLQEGFDELYLVRLIDGAGFEVANA